MAKLQMKSGFERKMRLLLILTLAHSIIKKIGLTDYIDNTVSWDPAHWDISPGNLALLLVLSTFSDIRTPFTHLEDHFKGIDLEFFLGTASRSASINSFKAGRALERIGKANPEEMYETLALSVAAQAGIPTERLHADTTTISFYGEYDVEQLNLTEERAGRTSSD